MKTKQLLLALMVGVAMCTVACKKCQTCSYQGGTETEVCRNAYGTPGLYNAQIQSLENQGYDCK